MDMAIFDSSSESFQRAKVLRAVMDEIYNRPFNRNANHYVIFLHNNVLRSFLSQKDISSLHDFIKLNYLDMKSDDELRRVFENPSWLSRELDPVDLRNNRKFKIQVVMSYPIKMYVVPKTTKCEDLEFNPNNLFFSHKWYSDAEPFKNHKDLSYLVDSINELIVETRKDKTYVWIDHFNIVKDPFDYNEIELSIRMSCVILPGVKGANYMINDNYFKSLWCFYESIVGCYNNLKTTYDNINMPFLYDLPGFKFTSPLIISPSGLVGAFESLKSFVNLTRNLVMNLDSFKYSKLEILYETDFNHISKSLTTIRNHLFEIQKDINLLIQDVAAYLNNYQKIFLVVMTYIGRREMNAMVDFPNTSLDSMPLSGSIKLAFNAIVIMYVYFVNLYSSLSLELLNKIDFVNNEVLIKNSGSTKTLKSSHSQPVQFTYEENSFTANNLDFLSDNGVINLLRDLKIDVQDPLNFETQAQEQFEVFKIICYYTLMNLDAKYKQIFHRIDSEVHGLESRISDMYGGKWITTYIGDNEMYTLKLTQTN